MGQVLMTIRLPPGTQWATAEQVEARYGLPLGSVDRNFGVVEVDETHGEHAVLVDETAAARMTADPTGQIRGPFSDPGIGTFGPPG